MVVFRIFRSGECHLQMLELCAAHRPEEALSSIGQAVGYARYAWRLRSFLREPVTAERGREMAGNLLRNRAQNWLDAVRSEVYDNASSPYLPLLRLAGCEYGDFEHMVRSLGIEPMLHRLRAEGVYLTNEEFKGRQEVVRGGKTFTFKPTDFNNRNLTGGLQTSTSGSRGPRMATMMRLDRLAHNAAVYSAVLSAHGLQGRPTVLWMPILPSGAGITHLLQWCKMRATPRRWFSPVAATAIKPPLSKRLATLYVVHAGRLFGVPIPSPEYVSGEQVHIVADYLRELLRHESGCVVTCSPSSAVRVCHVARTAGTDLTGVTFVVGGEPLTPAKFAEIRQVGAHAINLYAFSEGGIIGYGCAGERHVCDDVHVQQISLAVIQHERQTKFGGGAVNAFLCTTMTDKSSKVLLNVENGDYGVLETRECGCDLGALGLTQHVHTIRSFDKLTGEGMTFVGTDLVRLIEEVLPSRFGGASTDYQMVEVEDVEGRTRLNVVVSPDVGVVDEAEVVNCILAELAAGDDTNRMMAEVWRQGGVLRVKRERPHLTQGGKMLSLHIMRTPGG